MNEVPSHIRRWFEGIVAAIDFNRKPGTPNYPSSAEIYPQYRVRSRGGDDACIAIHYAATVDAGKPRIVDSTWGADGDARGIRQVGETVDQYDAILKRQ
jgi:hypothetical protein